MTRYRLLERQIPDQGWAADGVVYTEGNLFLFYRASQTIKFRIDDLSELNEEHFPYEKDIAFRWGSIQEWNDDEPFTPQTILEASSQKVKPALNKPKYSKEEEIPLEVRQVLTAFTAWNASQEAWIKEDFINLLEGGYPVYKMIVEAIWHQWSRYGEDKPPFRQPEYNVALLLYARAFGLPIADYPAQTRYLESHKELFAPVIPNSAGWGARTSISDNVKTLLDAPVMNVWVFKHENVIQKLLIVGKGLDQFRNQLFSDFLITAMRVQGSFIDVINEGIVSIERSINPESVLDISLPVLGMNVPLPDANTSDAAFQELVRRLRQLQRDTGFVRMYEVDAGLAESFKNNLYDLAKESIANQEPIIWAPDPEATGGQEMVVMQQVLALPEQRSTRRMHLPPIRFQLSLDLFRTAKWQELLDAFQEEAINSIYWDAKIRLDYYKNRAESLTAEKKRWDSADSTTQLDQWGPTIMLNQRFDDKSGLTIWLQKPIIKSTKEYFEEIVPNLIHGHKVWAEKMQRLIDDLKTAARRPDAPFRRLVMTRLYDSAIRGTAITYGSRVPKLYSAWKEMVADLLHYEFRRKLGQVGARVEDLFNAHTTFNLVQILSDSGSEKSGISGMVLIPNTLIDFQRSLVVFDPNRSFMVASDASDMPADSPEVMKEIDLRRKIENEWETLSVDGLAEELRKELIHNPLLTNQLLRLLGTQSTPETLSNDKLRILQIYQQAQAETLNFVRLLDLAENATLSHAQITVLESIDSAQRALPQVLKRWNELRANLANGEADAMQPVPSQSDLECRLYLLRALWLSSAAGHVPKDYLTAIYHSPSADGLPEIRQAVELADKLNPEYTKKFIESLAQWDANIASSMLKQNLPSEKDLLDPVQHQAISVFDVFDLIKVAKKFEDVIIKLSPNMETQSAAFLKIGPALETALTSYPSSIAYNDVIYLLEILTGREVSFKRGI